MLITGGEWHIGEVPNKRTRECLVYDRPREDLDTREWVGCLLLSLLPGCLIGNAVGWSIHAAGGANAMQFGILAGLSLFLLFVIPQLMYMRYTRRNPLDFRGVVSLNDPRMTILSEEVGVAWHYISSNPICCELVDQYLVKTAFVAEQIARMPRPFKDRKRMTEDEVVLRDELRAAATFVAVQINAQQEGQEAITRIVNAPILGMISDDLRVERGELLRVRSA